MIDQSAPTTLVLRHTFDAPRERVFAAWSTPEILREFIAPGEMKARVDADVRPGGSYCITMIRPDGEEWPVRGVYREVQPPNRIVCTWAWDEDDPADRQETLLTLEFHARGEQTELVLTHEHFRDVTQRDRHHEGWSAIVLKLAERVA